MSKIKNSKIFFLGVAIVVVLGLYSTTVWAETGEGERKAADKVNIPGQERQKKTETERKTKFCEKLSQFSTNVDQKMTMREADWMKRKSELSDKWREMVLNREQNLNDFRQKRDGNIAQHFSKLEERATTEEQKKAVAAFQVSVKTALETKRKAVDAAMLAFREGVNGVVMTKKAEKNNFWEGMKTQKGEALRKAQTDCENGVEINTIMENFRSNLKGVVEKRSGQGGTEEKVRNQIEQLSKVRRQAMEKAAAEFRASIQKAVSELKTAFPKETSDASAR